MSPEHWHVPRQTYPRAGSGISAFARSNCRENLADRACVNCRVTFSVPPPLAELVPILFLDLDTVELSGLFDICKGEVTVFGRNAFDLIETRQGIPYVSGVSQRLFALTRKGNTLCGKSD